MRGLAVPLGFLGAAASLVFWAVLPFLPFAGSSYVHAGNELFYVTFAVLSAIGIVGSLLAAANNRWSPLLLGLAIIPGIGALLVPGLMLVFATLLALDETVPSAARPVH